MNVLWITNAPFPEVYEGKYLEDNVKSWIHASAHQLIKHFPAINLAVASIYPGNSIKQIKEGKIIHYLIPNKVRINALNPKSEYFWKQIDKQFEPDLVHIHGTEYPYTYFFTQFSKHRNIVVSIQGLVSVIARYYRSGISEIDSLKSVTLRDLVRQDTVFSQHKNMRIRGKFEKLLLQTVNHVIGRTTWDHVHAKRINPNVNYHFCNETLRPPFYTNKWSLQNCEKHSIFISQANYTIKGFHQLTKALPLILKDFPETKVYVGGIDFYNNSIFRLSGYGRYLKSLIKKYNLQDSITFTGTLSEMEMCRQFLNSHVFVCPSSIENSSNSIGEAQILGVPTVASYVGGTPDMIDSGKTGLLYRFEEFEMLAAHICKLFSDDELALQIAENSRIIAAKRHNKKQNAKKLFDIYSSILTGKQIVTQ